jgi:hypothetical protein
VTEDHQCCCHWVEGREECCICDATTEPAPRLVHVFQRESGQWVVVTQVRYPEGHYSRFYATYEKEHQAESAARHFRALAGIT